MSRVELITCDRCGDSSPVSVGLIKGAGWGRAYAAELGGKDRIGTSERPLDLCGSCMDDLVAFMVRIDCKESRS